MVLLVLPPAGVTPKISHFWGLCCYTSSGECLFAWRDSDDVIFVSYSADRGRLLLPDLRRSKRYFDTINRKNPFLLFD